MLKSKDKIKIKVIVTIHSVSLSLSPDDLSSFSKTYIGVKWKRGDNDSQNKGETPSYKVLDEAQQTIRMEHSLTVLCSVIQDQKSKKFEPKRMDFYIVDKTEKKEKVFCKGALDLGAYSNPGTYSSQSLPLKSSKKTIKSASVLLTFDTSWLKLNNKLLEKSSSSSSTSSPRSSLTSKNERMEIDGEEYYLRTCDEQSVDEFSDYGSVSELSEDEDEGSEIGLRSSTTQQSLLTSSNSSTSSFSKKIRESITLGDLIKKDSGGSGLSLSPKRQKRDELYKQKELNKKLKNEINLYKKEIELYKKRVTKKDISEISEEVSKLWASSNTTNRSASPSRSLSPTSSSSIGDIRSSMNNSYKSMNSQVEFDITSISQSSDPTPFVIAIEKNWRRSDHENNLELLHYLSVTTTLYDSCEKEFGVRQDMSVIGIPMSNDPMSFIDDQTSITSMLRSLELLIYDIYFVLWSNIQNELDNSIIPATLEAKVCIWEKKIGGTRTTDSLNYSGGINNTPGGGVVGGNNSNNKGGSNSNSNGNSGHQFVSNLYKNCKSSFLLDSVIRQLFHQIFYYLNCKLVNNLLVRRDLCNYSSGFHLKMCLSQIEDSLSKLDRKILMPIWNKYAQAVKEAANVLLLDKSLFEDKETIISVFNSLNPLQIKTLLDSFTTDQLSGAGVSQTAKDVLDDLTYGRKFQLELDWTILLDLPLK